MQFNLKMRKTIFILKSILFLSSCVSADKLSKPRKGVFLFDSNEGVTSIYKSSSLKKLVKKLINIEVYTDFLSLK